MNDSEASPGPATNLLRSLVHLGGTLLAIAQTRVELFTTEVSEDLERGLHVVLWAVLAILAAMFAALLAALGVVAYFWDTHRMAAIVVVTATFALLAVLAGLTARKLLHVKPRLLDATRTELQRDVSTLRSGP